MTVLCVVSPVGVSHHDYYVWSVLWVCLIMTVLCVVSPVGVSHHDRIVCGQSCGCVLWLYYVWSVLWLCLIMTVVCGQFCGFVLS